MKKILILILVSLPLWTIQNEKTTLPVSAYAVWGGENIKASSIWFNLPKNRRLAIIDSIYKSKKQKS